MLRGARATEGRDERRGNAGRGTGGARRRAGLLLGELASGRGPPCGADRHPEEDEVWETGGTLEPRQVSSRLFVGGFEIPTLPLEILFFKPPHSLPAPRRVLTQPLPSGPRVHSPQWSWAPLAPGTRVEGAAPRASPLRVNPRRAAGTREEGGGCEPLPRRAGRTPSRVRGARGWGPDARRRGEGRGGKWGCRPPEGVVGAGPRRSQVSRCFSPKNLTGTESPACHLVSRARRPYIHEDTLIEEIGGGGEEGGDYEDTWKWTWWLFSPCDRLKGKHVVTASGMWAMVL